VSACMFVHFNMADRNRRSTISPSTVQHLSGLCKELFIGSARDKSDDECKQCATPGNVSE